MRRIVLISTSVLAAGAIAFGVYLSAQSLAPQPSPSGGSGGTSTCAPGAKEEPDAGSDDDRAACNDTTGKPGEVKP